MYDYYILPIPHSLGMISGIGIIPCLPPPGSNAECAHAWMKNRRSDGGIFFKKDGLVRAKREQSSMRGEGMWWVGSFGGVEESLVVRNVWTRYGGELVCQTKGSFQECFSGS